MTNTKVAISAHWDFMKKRNKGVVIYGSCHFLRLCYWNIGNTSVFCCNIFHVLVSSVIIDKKALTSRVNHQNVLYAINKPFSLQLSILIYCYDVSKRIVTNVFNLTRNTDGSMISHNGAFCSKWHHAWNL